MSTNDVPGGILVTPEMLAAGLEELSEHHFGDDLGWILECVFRAMAYESPQIDPFRIAVDTDSMAEQISELKSEVHRLREIVWSACPDLVYPSKN